MTRLGQRRFGLMVAMLLVGGAVGVAGCNTGSTVTDDEEVGQGEAAVQEGAADEDAAEDEAPQAKTGEKAGKREHHADRGDRGRMGRMGHGPEMLFMAALNELELSDAQRTTIESALEGLRKDRPEPPAHEEMKQRGKALAEAIRANSVDAEALAPKDIEMPDFAKGRQKLTAALKTLHDTLTSDQRTALVASIKEKAPKGGPMDGPNGGPDKKGGPGHHGGDFVEMLLHGIDVDDAQRTKITAALEAAGLAPSEDKAEDRKDMHEQMKAKMEAALEAFQKDVFVADDVVPAPPAKMKHGGPKDFVKALEVAVPLLTVEQREALADRIEAGPPGRHGKGKMGSRKEAN